MDTPLQISSINPVHHFNIQDIVNGAQDDIMLHVHDALRQRSLQEAPISQSFPLPAMDSAQITANVHDNATKMDNDNDLFLLPTKGYESYY